jgi:predicted RNA-binding Zn ribbon-like protein
MERFGPTRRGGPVFRWLGEHLAVDLANTVMVVRDDELVDLVATSADLARWLSAEAHRLPQARRADVDLAEFRALRDATRELLAAAARGIPPSRRSLDHVNAASAAAPVAPRLEQGGHAGLRALHEPAGGDARARLLGTLARATIELVGSPEGRSLQICAAPSCGMFFLGSRRWCCAACGNRARAARHYERVRARRGAA